MGEAKRRGTFEQRKTKAIKEGRDKDKLRRIPKLLYEPLAIAEQVEKIEREINVKDTLVQVVG
jgi:hypothetical protein